MGTLPARTWRPRAQLVDGSVRPTRAEISLGAVAHNLATVRAALPRATRVLAVVKADAYGHGVVPVAHRLQAEGVDGFGVALAEEGIELREAGINRAILVLNGIYGHAHEDILAAGLTPALYEIGEAEAFQQVSKGRPVDVHLKVDTGMGRLGVPMGKLEAFLAALRRYPAIRIAGLMSHLSTADEDPEYVRVQLAQFKRAEGLLRRYGQRPAVRHVGNSAAVFRHPEAHFDWVRTGIALYGYAGADGLSAPLKPTMRWRTQIIRLRTLQIGESVGYGRSFVARTETHLATIPLGYGDGLLRAASNRAEVLVRGRRCRVLGNVSMDLTTIDVSSVPDVAIGDEVLLLGEQGEARLGIEDLARAAQTIPYEVLTNVSRRVPRTYSND